ncbi:MAG: helix-turn-helix transcriptional regulator [Bacteroidia bacterium]|nr:helix-turn-helix transcriptional regulator [Bacteroidia bacterium]
MTKIREENFILDFGQNIRKIRLEKGITMEKLAELCNVEYTQIARIERGKINTSISMVKRLGESLGVKVGELFEF